MLSERVLLNQRSRRSPGKSGVRLSDSCGTFSDPTLGPFTPSASPASSPLKFLGALPVGLVCTQTSLPKRKPFTVKRFRRHQTGSSEIALIVSTYQKPWHLVRVLKSITLQQGTRGLFEVVITDDGSTDETHRIVEEFARSVHFSVSLTTHKHTTFQLARCRNEGVVVSRAPYLLFLDGDCVLPPDHVQMHLQHRQPGRAMCGYCARLDKAASQRFDSDAIQSAEYTRWVSPAQAGALAKRDRKARFYRLIRHPTKPRLTGGNCGIWRSDLETVNGFDENFEGWGGEDTDMGLRLRRVGVQIESILRWTHTYHLWHIPDITAPRRIRDGVNQPYFNRGFRFTRCMNGLVKRVPERAAFVVVGRPDRPEQADMFLRDYGLSVSTRVGSPTHAREIELLFLPGDGRFSGRAECNVLVVFEDCSRAKYLARRAHVLVADTEYRHGPSGDFFKLDDFRCALDRIMGR